jgi:hypothetical protein
VFLGKFSTRIWFGVKLDPKNWSTGKWSYRRIYPIQQITQSKEKFSLKKYVCIVSQQLKGANNSDFISGSHKQNYHNLVQKILTRKEKKLSGLQNLQRTADS